MHKIWKHKMQKIGKILPRSKKSGVKCKMQKIRKHKMKKMGKILLIYKKSDVKCQMQKIWRRKMQKQGKVYQATKNLLNAKNRVFSQNAKNREKSTKLQKIWRLMQKWGNIKSKK